MTNTQSWFWYSDVRISGTVMHVLAILVTIFRLVYRRWIARFWWEDMWAALALICDIGCFVTIWTPQPPWDSRWNSRIARMSHWLSSITITCVLWFARMSILSSIVRTANPSTKLRRVAHCTGALFSVMGIGILVQRVVICVQDRCRFTDNAALSDGVALAQLVTDIISDTLLVVAPIQLLRNVNLSRDQRILILSIFSASVLVTGITIFHSILLLEGSDMATLVLTHVKTALALLVCNTLVLVTLVHRLVHKSANDLEHSIIEGVHSNSNVVQFTSVITLPSQV